MYIDCEIPVRYAETDKMGVVYHANYLLYMEDARTHFLETLGMPYTEMEDAGLMSPVVDAHLHYGQPLRYGDTVVVRTCVRENKPTKTTYAYAFYRKGMDMDAEKPLATAESVHCVVDSVTFRPVSVKKRLPELFEKYAQIVEPAE